MINPDGPLGVAIEAYRKAVQGNNPREEHWRPNAVHLKGMSAAVNALLFPDHGEIKKENPNPKLLVVTGHTMKPTFPLVANEHHHSSSYRVEVIHEADDSFTFTVHDTDSVSPNTLNMHSENAKTLLFFLAKQLEKPLADDHFTDDQKAEMKRHGDMMGGG